MGDEAWSLLTRPIGASLESAFGSDLVRGVVLTDGLIGTWARSDEDSLRQNRCFLYHIVGNGTGDWDVPVGGMGAVTKVSRLPRGPQAFSSGRRRGDVDRRGRVAVEWCVPLMGASTPLRPSICTAAPRRAGSPAGQGNSRPTWPGSQLKVNMLLRRLPRLVSGVDPASRSPGRCTSTSG